MLELLALASDADAAARVAADLGAATYRFHPGESDRRPFSAMLRASTDRIEELSSVADVGLYTVFARTVKALTGPAPAERVIGAFGLVRKEGLSHRQADDHWRDVHGPLALVNHAAMCDYTQLSVVANLSGVPLDGMALCAFASRDDLRTKFFNDDAARAVIEADVATFANTRASLRRVVLVQTAG